MASSNDILMVSRPILDSWRSECNIISVFLRWNWIHCQHTVHKSMFYWDVQCLKKKTRGIYSRNLQNTTKMFCFGFFCLFLIKNLPFIWLWKELLHILAEYWPLSALCKYMLAIVESWSSKYAEMLKNWQGTENSIEEVGGNTFSVVLPL